MVLSIQEVFDFLTLFCINDGKRFLVLEALLVQRLLRCAISVDIILFIYGSPRFRTSFLGYLAMAFVYVLWRLFSFHVCITRPLEFHKIVWIKSYQAFCCFFKCIYVIKIENWFWGIVFIPHVCTE